MGWKKKGKKIYVGSDGDKLLGLVWRVTETNYLELVWGDGDKTTWN